MADMLCDTRTTRVVMAVGTSAHKNHKLTWTCFAMHLLTRAAAATSDHTHSTPRQLRPKPFPMIT